MVELTSGGADDRRPARWGYRQLARVPGARRILGFGLLGRAPLSMLPVALVLVGEHVTGSYALGGAAAAGFSLAGAGMAPIAGRWVDRYGQRRVGRRLVAVFVAACLGLLAVAAGATGGATWALVPVSALAGASAPNLGAYARARWGSLVPASEVEAAQAMESINDEVNHLVGPASATALATSVGGGAALAIAMLCSLTGTLGLTSLPEPRGAGPVGPPTAEGRWLTAHRLWVLATMVGLGAALGGMLVLIVSYTQSIGHAGGAAIVLALNSTASLVAALVVGRLVLRTHPRRRLTISLVVFGILLWPLALTDSMGAFAGAGFVAGAAIAPTFIQAHTYVALTTAPERSTEAFSVLAAGVALGLAAGSTLGGVVVDHLGADAGRSLIVLIGSVPAIIAAVGEVADRQRDVPPLL